MKPKPGPPDRISIVVIYQPTDRLHEGRTVRVPTDQIVATMSEWLAELGAHSALVEDLARAVRAGDWHSVHRIANSLSVRVEVAAA